MASTDATAEPLVNDAQSNSVNDTKTKDENEDNSSPKRAKLDEGEPSASRKTRSSGKNKRSDAVMMAEAKAAFGDLDTSEGRRLRKRSTEPSKAEEKKSTPRRTSSRRKGSVKATEPDEDEDEEEETAEETQAVKKNGSDEKSEDGLATKDGVLETKPDGEKTEKTEDTSGNGEGVMEDLVREKDEQNSEEVKKTKESEEKQPVEDGEQEKTSKEKPTSD